MEKLVQLFKDLFSTPIGEMMGYEVVLLVLLAIAGLMLLKKVLKVLADGFKRFFRALGRSLSLKKRCSKIFCRTCGRTLDSCVCSENKGLSLRKRLHKYYKSEKLRRKAIKKVK